MPLSPGDKIGPYEILALAGAGGMGQVFRARDTRLDRIVAIKTLQGPHTDRFEREARAISALNHPHICTLFDVGKHDAVEYLVLEFVDGRPIEGPLAPKEAMGLGLQICAALEAAHKLGIVHRDLKPGNILVTKRGVKLLDFGLAKRRREGREGTLDKAPRTETLTDSQIVMGTPQYMAPEQIEGKEADRRSDIFALGCVLYEMLTGKKAFPGKTASSVATAIMTQEPAPLRELQPLACEELAWVVETCLRKDPEERWESSHDVGLHLARILEGRGLGSKAGSRKRLVWTAVAAGLVLAGAGIWAGLSGKNAFVGDPFQFQIWPQEGTQFSSFEATVPTAQFAVSPSGRELAFTAARQGTPMLWIRRFSEDVAHAVGGTEGAQQPFWSPDSKTVGFFAQGSLKLVGSAGGPVASIASVSMDPRGATWMLDQTIVYAPSNHQGLWRIPAAGGVAERLECETEAVAQFPSALPDGKRVLYLLRHTDPEKRGIHVGPVRGGKGVKLLTSEMSGIYAEPGYLLYPNAGMLIARSFKAGATSVGDEQFHAGPAVGASNGYPSVSVSTNGVMAKGDALIADGVPTWFTRSGTEEEGIGNIGDYSDFRLSPDGRRLVVSLNAGETGTPRLWLHDLLRGVVRKMASEPLLDASPVWSPNGEYLVFRNNRAGLIGLKKRDMASGQVSEVLSAEQRKVHGNAGNYVPTDITPDGKYLIYNTTGSSGHDIFAVPLAGGGLPRKVVASAHREMHGNISPDGHWIAYTSDESGSFQVYVQSFETGERKEMVSIEGGAEPRWRGDGGELYYLSADKTLMAVPMQNADPGKPMALFVTTAPADVSPFRQRYVPTSDGKRFLVHSVAVGERPKPISVHVNWLSSVKR